MDFYHNWGWAMLALASIRTGGGGVVEGDAVAGRDYTGRDRISIYADQEAWRSGVADKFEDVRDENWRLREDIQRLRMQLMTSFILIALLFLIGFAATTFAIYRFGHQQDKIDILERDMERYFYTRPPLSIP